MEKFQTTVCIDKNLLQQADVYRITHGYHTRNRLIEDALREYIETDNADHEDKNVTNSQVSETKLKKRVTV